MRSTPRAAACTARSASPRGGAGIGALNGWTLVTTEVARAAAQDGMFPKAFAWADHKDTAWFGILMAALLPSLLMLWNRTTATGLRVLTGQVAAPVDNPPLEPAPGTGR